MDEVSRTFEAFYATHYRKIQAYVRRRTTNWQDVDDLVASTFLVAWRRFDEVSRLDQPLAWLYGTANRTLANHRRTEARAQKLLERAAAGAPSSDQDRATDEIAARQDVDHVLVALASLAERDQEVLRLTAFEALRPAEIAVVLGISPAVARTILFRARRRLRQALADLDGPSTGAER